MPGRSTQSLDGMNARHWFTVLWIASWAAQLFNLWPLPSHAAQDLLETARELGSSAPADAARGIAAYERTLWLSWGLTALTIPLGIAAGVVTWQNHPKWPTIVLVMSIATFFIFRVWQLWAPIYGPIFVSVERALPRLEFLLTQPRLIYNTLIFPGVLVAGAVFSAFAIRKRRTTGHAI